MPLYWYVIIGVLAALAIATPLVAERRREYRLHRAGLDDISHMTDVDMVLHMARLFGSLGYRVYRPSEPDSGFDLILADGLDQRRGVVVRHWRLPVDGGVVDEAIKAADRMGGAPPMVVTVQYYTGKARAAAQSHGVILWSLPELTEAIGRVKQWAMAFPDLPSIHPVAGSVWPSPPPRLGAAAASHDAALGQPRVRRRPERQRRGQGWSSYGVPLCPRCARKMVVRSGGDGEYWGCPTFPRCLGTRPK